LHQETQPTPAHTHNDGIDYVPTRREVLLGHHFSSIAGAAPIVGPAVAVSWGWVPALLWVVFGTIFLGAVHDFGTLVISLRHKGESIAHVCERVLGARARNLFLIVILFLVWMVIAVFALVIGVLFSKFPASVLPVNFEIIIALLIGWFINRRGGNILIPSLLAQVSLLIMIYLGTLYPISLAPVFGEFELMAWIVFLLIYSYIASTLPVWLLLQPRDFINSHQLFLGLGAMILGLIIVHPPIVAPAFNPNPSGAPPWFPFLFITIACGAISGFHGLVSSGTTSKQINKWTDCRQVGYGGMLGEGVLALLATLAVAAGFSSSSEWHSHYASWGAANGLSAKIGAFVKGSSSFISGLGINQSFSETVVAVMIISFAATSLDTATRIQRYIIKELGVSFNLPVLKNRHIGATIAVVSAFLLMLATEGGKGGLLIWPLFGATNQMLACLSLIVISVYLIKQKKNSKPYLIPVLFMLVVTTFGLALNIKNFFEAGRVFLGVLAAVLLAIQFWIIIAGYQGIKASKQ